MNLYSNVIYSNNVAYRILKSISIHHFLNKDQSINKQVLGMYVHEIGGDHVLQQNNKFLICETIEEAQIIQ